jgi:large subunit ribosomal protein L1
LIRDLYDNAVIYIDSRFRGNDKGKNMGRPKVKIIDDSQPEADIKTKKANKTSQDTAGRFGSETTEKTEVRSKSVQQKKGGDSLVESLKAELGIEETKTPKAEPKEAKTEEKKAVPAKKISKKAKNNRSKKYLSKVEELNGQPEEGQEELVDFRSKSYKLAEAVELVKKASYTKYTGTLEAHINTATTGIRGTVSLPFASGRKMRVAAFGKGAETSGADLVGDDALLENIKKGKMDFDVLITTAQWMPKFAPLARVLGPRGLMPNPKNGTITIDLKKAVESYQAGKTEYKTESKTPVMHLSLGKLDQPTEELSANIKVLLQTLGKSRVKKVTLAPTMGPSVRLDLTSI